MENRLILFRNDLIYTSCYWLDFILLFLIYLFFILIIVFQISEENIWKLLQYVIDKNRNNVNPDTELFAVFISNESRTVGSNFILKKLILSEFLQI